MAFVKLIAFAALIASASALFDICDIGENRCLNGGRCLSTETVTGTPGTWSCICKENYSGTSCEWKVRSCVDIKCNNGGTCQEISAGTCAVPGSLTNPGDCFTCVCPTGYLGQFCDIVQPDPCLSTTCQNGGTCAKTTTQPYFSCTCPSTFTGTLCQNPSATPVQDPCVSAPCQNGGTCNHVYAKSTGTAFANKPASYGPSFTTGDHAINAFTCSCLPGYYGDFCQYTYAPSGCGLISPPCANAGTCACATLGTCTNFGDDVCQCQPPSSATGSGSFKIGYNNPYCNNTAPTRCRHNPCLNGGACGDVDDDYYCTCVNGYYGKNCENWGNQCSHTKCQNGGACIGPFQYTSPKAPVPIFRDNWSFTCQCRTGYVGFYCETVETNDCASSPCQNGGTCIDKYGLYQCACPQNFMGPNCETDITNMCASNPCQNGGVCTPAWSSTFGFRYTCTCKLGYSGQNCQHSTSQGNIVPQYSTTLEFCVGQNPCQFGGTCHVQNSRAWCTCPPRRLGAFCEYADPRNFAGLTSAPSHVLTLLCALVTLAFRAF